jgi:rSAM/selenodomain-associated transferase 2
MVSVIIPTLNEAATITPLVHAVRNLAGAKEIIVVDGESADGTAALAAAAGAQVIQIARGRGQQLSTGADAAKGEVLWFLHADCVPAQQALAAITEALRDERVVAGNFALAFDGGCRAAARMNWIYPKLRWLGLSYGDAGIFVRRSAYQAIGGIRPYGLFEDLDLVTRLRPLGRFVHLECPLTASSRRFAGRNFASMWTHWITLQSLYWLGVKPDTLARWYRPVR